MEQPSIWLIGVQIYEPITALTNLILSGCCLFLANYVRKSNAKDWSYFFYLLTVSTFFAAFGHGWFSDKDNYLQLISRCFNVMAVYSASLASLKFLKQNGFISTLKIFVFVQCIMALLLILYINKFYIVIWDSILGLGILVGLINLYLGIYRNRAALIIVLGILVNGTTSYIHANKISISKWFNHNDISHFILLIGFYFMALGASKLNDYSSN